MERKWWKEAVFYQIYPKSFYDSNGDGIGDLRGIAEKLPYLKSLGITAIWICPFFKSPMKDNGYDISDYYDVNPEFGTMDDVDELLKCAKEQDIRIILDMVINHTSDQHKWFQEACRDKNSKYRDYYIFKDRIDGLADLRNNFGGSTWTQIEDGSWYFHTFAKEQPDLNWDNEQMREEIYDMINWWLDKGVSGFRMDAITYIKKDQNFPPMPADGKDGRCDVAKCCLNCEGIAELLQDIKKHTYGCGDYMTVAEAPGVPNEQLEEYIGENGHFSMIFDFSYTDIDVYPGEIWLKKRPWTMEEFKTNLFRNQYAVASTGWAANYLENHDQSRSIDKYFPKEDIPEYKEKMAKALGTLFFFLKGTPFIYQGEELGILNTRFQDISQLDDINSVGQYKRCLAEGYTEEQAMESVNRRSRDHARLPMQWTEEANCGFSTGKPWIACNNRCTDISVEKELADENSVLMYYKNMITLRNKSELSDALIYGDISEIEGLGENLIGYKRSLGEKTISVIVNMGNERYDMHSNLSNPEILLDNYGTHHAAGVLQPYEAIVYTMK